MRIGLVADPCDPKTPGGLGRSIYEWTHSFIAENKDDQLFVYAKHPEAFEAPQLKTFALPENVWLKGAHALDASLDVFIFFTPAIPLFFRPKRAIVVAADFAYLELPQSGISERVRAFASYLMHRRSLQLAERVVCMSGATKERAIDYFGVRPEKCIVIPIAAMPLSAEEPVANVPPRFFFFAGALKERKNVANLIRAFALFTRAHPELGTQFLIAGKKNGAPYEKLAALVRSEGVEEYVRFLGYVSDGQITYLYRHAEALVFASLVEGFGMPVLEAMSAGCPVITADRGAVAEIAGDAALLADPHAPEAIAGAMARIASDPGLRAALIEKGKVQSAHFSWAASAKRLRAVLSGG